MTNSRYNFYSHFDGHPSILLAKLPFPKDDLTRGRPLYNVALDEVVTYILNCYESYVVLIDNCVSLGPCTTYMI